MFVDNELDVVAVQEMEVESQEQADRIVQLFQAPFSVCVSHSIRMSKGCCLFIRGSLGVEQAVSSCPPGRFVFCDSYFSNMERRAICIYASNRERERRGFL